MHAKTARPEMPSEREFLSCDSDLVNRPKHGSIVASSPASPASLFIRELAAGTAGGTAQVR